MRIAGQFKKNKKEFRAQLKKFNNILEVEKKPSGYIINKLLSKGSNWYDCYVYEEVIIIYRKEGDYLVLQRLGRAGDLYKK